MEPSSITTLIVFYAKLLSFDPNIALAVAKVESSLNPNAIGGQGEIGLFQLKPQFVKGVTKQELINPHTNIITGINRLKEEKEKCVHKSKLNYLVCYNYGRTNARKVIDPNTFPYVIKVTKEYNKLKKESFIYGQN
jgi:soluble lytic murein transglycosylase-like protein